MCNSRDGETYPPTYQDIESVLLGKWEEITAYHPKRLRTRLTTTRALHSRSEGIVNITRFEKSFAYETYRSVRKGSKSKNSGYP